MRGRTPFYPLVAFGVVAGLLGSIGLGEIAARHVMKIDPPGGFAEADARARASHGERWWTEAADGRGIVPLPAVPVPDRAARQTQPVERAVLVGKGDTLIDLLLRAGASALEAHDAIAALRRLFNPRAIKPGLELKFTFGPGEEGQNRLIKVSLPTSAEQTVKVERGAEAEFSASKIARPLARELVRAGGTIRSSLYEDGVGSGIPAPLLVELIRAFSYDVDFQREIQPGDRFEVAYERFMDKANRVAKTGDIVYAALTLSDRTLKIYRYTPKGGVADYFNDKGESVKKALLRTPLDGARLTSRFGVRLHPILGYSTMHKGVDFGAARGTPIMAAGDGTVELAGWNGGYGNYVRLRHSGQYATAYAHMSRIASGLRKGSRVRQGQVIGYVGATGLATGPHLHYEVLVHDAQINPASVKLPTGVKLAGATLQAFEEAKAKTDAMLVSLPAASKTAQTAF